VISKKDKTGSKVVHIARPTECFGELALLYNHPRAATVKVSDQWSLIPSVSLAITGDAGGS
jgi:CRP-like cAMP-binding protein